MAVQLHINKKSRFLKDLVLVQKEIIDCDQLTEKLLELNFLFTFEFLKHTVSFYINKCPLLNVQCIH